MLSDSIADGAVRPIYATIGSQLVMSSLNMAYEARHWAHGFETEADAILVYTWPLCAGLTAPLKWIDGLNTILKLDGIGPASG